MISVNDTLERPKAAPIYRVRTEAMAAAVFTLGPHARHGFEFETFKCDGRWGWKATDEIRPPTPAQIKANGGKKSLIQLQEGTAMAKANETTIMPACNGLDVAKPDGLDIPTFLKREPKAKSGTYTELKTGGALRSEPVPSVSRETSAKPAGKPPVSRKPAKAKTAVPAKKIVSEAETKTAGHPTSKAALIKAAILDWKDDETIVQEVRAAFPGCEYKASDIKWYRRKMAQAKA